MSEKNYQQFKNSIQKNKITRSSFISNIINKNYKSKIKDKEIKWIKKKDNEIISHSKIISQENSLNLILDEKYKSIQFYSIEEEKQYQNALWEYILNDIPTQEELDEIYIDLEEFKNHKF